MNIYKITNITPSLGRRNPKYNAVLDVTYVDEMKNKKFQLKPNETVFLSISSLPLSVHRLRIKGLVSVSEVTNKELVQTMIVANPISEKNEKKEHPVKPEKGEIIDVKKKNKKVVATSTSDEEDEHGESESHKKDK